MDIPYRKEFKTTPSGRWMERLVWLFPYGDVFGEWRYSFGPKS